MLAVSLSILIGISTESSQSALTLSIFVAMAMVITFWVGGGGFTGSLSTDPFHPAFLFFMFAMIYVVLSSALVWLLHDYNSTWFDLGTNRITFFNKAICLSILACFAYGVGLRFPTWFDVSTKFCSSSRVLYERESRAIRWIAYIFFVCGFLATAYHLSLFGNENLFLYLSPSARRDSGVSVSQLVVMIESMLAWSAIFFIILMMRTRIKLVPVALVLIAIGMVYISTGKRTTVLPILLIPLIYYHYCHNWLGILKAARYFAGLIFFLVITVLGRMAMPLIARGDTPSEYMGDSSAAILEYYAISGEFMTFDMFLLSIHKGEIILETIGGALTGFFYYTIAIISVIIPRAIWPGKPDFWDLGNVYADLILDSDGKVGFAVTIFGTSYLFFGIVGLILGMFLFAWTQKIVYEWLRPYEGELTSVLYYGVAFWMAFQAMRFGTFGFTFVVFVQTMLVGVIAIWLVGRMREFKTYHYRIVNQNNE